MELIKSSEMLMNKGFKHFFLKKNTKLLNSCSNAKVFTFARKKHEKLTILIVRMLQVQNR